MAHSKKKLARLANLGILQYKSDSKKVKIPKKTKVASSRSNSNEVESQVPAAHDALEKENVDSVPHGSPRAESPQTTAHLQAYVEDMVCDEPQTNPPSPEEIEAEKAAQDAQDAAVLLDDLETRAHTACQAYEMAYGLAKDAEARALAALHVAQCAKKTYELNGLSFYQQTMHEAERKAASAVLLVQQRSRELDSTIEALKTILNAREEASTASRNLAQLAVQKLHQTTAVNINIDAPPSDIWDDEYIPSFEDIDITGEGETELDRDTADDMEIDFDDPEDSRGASGTTTAIDNSVISKKAAESALSDITHLLKPKRSVKGNRYSDPGFDHYTRSRLEAMKSLFWSYIDPLTDRTWMDASLHVARTMARGPYFAKMLRLYGRAYIRDRTDIPQTQYGTWTGSILDQHKEFAQELHLHLQSVGRYVTTTHLVQYMAREDVQKRWKLERDISLATAKRWMKKLGYRWTLHPSGQYVDGHERKDVVSYRQHVFLPAMADIEARIRSWKADGISEEVREWPNDMDDGPRPFQDQTVLWYHDESTFYANDRRKMGWVHKDAKAVPRAKGEGASLMVADFVSADYGWLESADKSKSARVLFKAGSARQGYFENKDVLDQVHSAMDILERDYPHQQHVFVFDNATTHSKRASDALSARRMPKNPPKEGSNFLVTRPIRGEDGRIIYGPNRKPLTESIRMANGQFHDGTEQEFYFPEGHPRAGIFKGMAIILEERGYTNCIGTNGRPAECKDFKCLPGAQDCCCRRLLFNEPDFANVPSLLEIECNARGFRVIFLPKFHCELNFIEQCWGYAKGVYRKYPTSSKEADLEKNLVSALAAIPLPVMRRFSNRSRRFMDAYRRGLNGKQAAWANKKYRGHRVLPREIFDDLKEAGLEGASCA